MCECFLQFYERQKFEIICVRRAASRLHAVMGFAILKQLGCK